MNNIVDELDAYLEKYCKSTGKSKYEALSDLIVQIFIQDKVEREACNKNLSSREVREIYEQVQS